ncbi:MAG TPA: ectonucleotide pyrophosphatase/phosphodiesterase [Steroidobacteraceae bacterium]
MRLFALVCFCALYAHVAAAAAKPTVLLISIDGLKPEAVIDAAAHGLKVPNLRAFMQDGFYSHAVKGVLPTVTYPSHATLLSGAAPARHGIVDNTTFDPLNRNDKGWYWYAEDMKVPTLWDAAHAAQLSTANVYWPTSVGATIDYNLPQIWRRGTDDDLKLQRALETKNLERELGEGLPRYPGGAEETVAEDELRTKFAIRLLERKHPDFFTVYLAGLDTEEHASGPFSAAANRVLERLDTLVGALRQAAEHAAPHRATVCVVSDHGFAAIQHDVNLYAAFRDAGLFSADKDGKISAWSAMPWPAGGTAAIMLANPDDAEVKAKVAHLLQQLAANPDNGIDKILERDQIDALGGFPGASFVVALKIGYEVAYALSPPLITPPSNLGMHGFLPEHSEMRSSFFMVGPNAPAGVDVGEIDMRSIAPTLAKVLGVTLRGAELEPLPLK